jgi:hypothetical protein
MNLHLGCRNLRSTSQISESGTCTSAGTVTLAVGFKIVQRRQEELMRYAICDEAVASILAFF